MNKHVLVDSCSKLVERVSFLKKVLPGIQDGITNSSCKLIEESLEEFSDFETVKLFISDCKQSVGGALNFSRTRNFIFTKTEPIVLAVFQASYNTHLGLDAIAYKEELPDETIRLEFPLSKATTVTILKCTAGFDQYPVCVALFPENFVAKDDFSKGFSVFYFVNVFLRRFEEFGKPILRDFVSKESFWRTKRLSMASLKLSFATWFHLHEHFHSQGILPFNDYFRIKSCRNTAALEELRVDVLSVLACLHIAKSGYDNAYLHAELILFERLLRYSAHANPKSNYDARSSLIFLNFLEESSAVSFKNGDILNLERAKLKDSLERYVGNVEELETQIKHRLETDHEFPPDYKKLSEPLVKFAQKYSGGEKTVENPFLNRIYAQSASNPTLSDHAELC